MKLELLGETSIPETINYLDNCYVYIGMYPIGDVLHREKIYVK